MPEHTETHDSTDTETTVDRSELPDIVWFAKSKDSDWQVGPYADHIRAIEESHTHKATTAETVETFHKQTKHVDDDALVDLAERDGEMR